MKPRERWLIMAKTTRVVALAVLLLMLLSAAVALGEEVNDKTGAKNNIEYNQYGEYVEVTFDETKYRFDDETVFGYGKEPVRAKETITVKLISKWIDPKLGFQVMLLKEDAKIPIQKQDKEKYTMHNASKSITENDTYKTFLCESNKEITYDWDDKEQKLDIHIGSDELEDGQYNFVLWLINTRDVLEESNSLYGSENKSEKYLRIPFKLIHDDSAGDNENENNDASIPIISDESDIVVVPEPLYRHQQEFTLYLKPEVEVTINSDQVSLEWNGKFLTDDEYVCEETGNGEEEYKVFEIRITEPGLTSDGVLIVSCGDDRSKEIEVTHREPFRVELNEDKCTGLIWHDSEDPEKGQLEKCIVVASDSSCPSISLTVDKPSGDSETVPLVTVNGEKVDATPEEDGSFTVNYVPEQTEGAATLLKFMVDYPEGLGIEEEICTFEVELEFRPALTFEAEPKTVYRNTETLTVSVNRPEGKVIVSVNDDQESKEVQITDEKTEIDLGFAELKTGDRISLKYSNDKNEKNEDKVLTVAALGGINVDADHDCCLDLDESKVRLNLSGEAGLPLKAFLDGNELDETDRPVFECTLGELKSATELTVRYADDPNDCIVFGITYDAENAVLRLTEPKENQEIEIRLIGKEDAVWLEFDGEKRMPQETDDVATIRYADGFNGPEQEVRVRGCLKKGDEYAINFSDPFGNPGSRIFKVEKATEIPVIVLNAPESAVNGFVPSGDVTFTGKALSYRDIRLFVDDTVMEFKPLPAADQDGNWKVTVELVPGDHRVRAEYADEEDIVYASETLSLTAVDTAAPYMAVSEKELINEKDKRLSLRFNSVNDLALLSKVTVSVGDRTYEPQVGEDGIFTVDLDRELELSDRISVAVTDLFGTVIPPMEFTAIPHIFCDYLSEVDRVYVTDEKSLSFTFTCKSDNVNKIQVSAISGSQKIPLDTLIVDRLGTCRLELSGACLKNAGITDGTAFGLIAEAVPVIESGTEIKPWKMGEGKQIIYDNHVAFLRVTAGTPYTEKTKQISGITEPNATVRLMINGMTVAEVTASEYGDFRIDVNKLKSHQKVNIEAEDEAGNKLKAYAEDQKVRTGILELPVLIILLVVFVILFIVCALIFRSSAKAKDIASDEKTYIYRNKNNQSTH